MNKMVNANEDVRILLDKYNADKSLKRELVEALKKRINQCCKDDLPPDQPYECCTIFKANLKLITRTEATL